MRTRDREGFVAFLRASRTSAHNHFELMGSLAFVFPQQPYNKDSGLKLSTSHARSFAPSSLLVVVQAIAAEFLGTLIFIFFSTGKVASREALLLLSAHVQDLPAGQPFL